MEIPTHPDSLINRGQVCSLLCVSERTLRRWVAKEEFPQPLSINGRIRWRLKAVQEWTRKKEIETAVDEKVKKLSGHLRPQAGHERPNDETAGKATRRKPNTD
jgi:predicted DNA-binding transcriptional regulator AlpA